MMFYFKSNDSSNKFYDNTYKFTKDISTILGRIEAGFGEKLVNLDKGYSVMLDKIDRSGLSQKEIDNAKESKKEIEKSIRTEVSERNDLIKDLIDKSNLEQKEKENLSKTLQTKENTILKLEKELKELRHKLDTSNINIQTDPQDVFISRLKHVLKKYGYNDLNNFNRNKAQEFISDLLKYRTRNNLYILNYLTDNNLIDSENNLKFSGYHILKSALAQNLYSN